MLKPGGYQHIIEFSQCSSPVMDEPEQLEKLLLDGIRISGLKSVGSIRHQFAPVGVTVAAIISESHVAIHTYPESRHASIDIFTCSRTDRHQPLIQYLKDALNPEEVQIMKVNRGHPLGSEPVRILSGKRQKPQS